MKKVSLPTKAVLLISATLTVMAGATIAPSLPQMAETFQHVPHADFLSRLILTLPALAIAFSSPIVGRLLDRVGRLKVMYPAMVIYAIGGSIGFFVEDIYVILVGRLFLGLGVAGIMNSCVTLIGDYFQGPERAKFVGLQASFMSFGGAIFLTLGGLLADLDWRYPFLIYLASLLVLGLAMRYLFEPERSQPSGGAVAPPPPFVEVFKMIGIILFLAFSGMTIFYAIPVQLPFLLREIGVESNTATGNAIAVATLVSTVVGFSYGAIKRRLSYRAIFLIICSAMAIGFALTARSNSLLEVMLGMVSVGVGIGMFMPNLNAWLFSKTTDQNRGQYMGYLNSSVFIGQFLSPIVAAPIITVVGLSGMFWVHSGVLVIGALYFGWLTFGWKR
ncbi:MFS transporter [Pontibacter sp. G13]|uniref:MFS transporter n=1 Tax=Pontibacter sp. G13 TaxID=3074898 RepID=UPI00288C6248|nr:MFS transporter [Pontibacter sp. G13]WNJ20141.1 MFS transporter [Pontibacter sp. G13]